jgi:hypothetical protein
MWKKYIQSKWISYKRSSNQAPWSTQSLVNWLYFNEREHTCILDYRRYKSPIETYEYIYEGQDRRVIVDVINNEEIANANADGNSESNLEYNIIYEKINNDHNYKKIDLPDLQK